MLTPRQSDLLKYIARYQGENDGVSPSFEQMMTELSLHSKSGVHRLISGLEERGYIRRLHNRARAIAIIIDPDGNPQNQTTEDFLRDENLDLKKRNKVLEKRDDTNQTYIINLRNQLNEFKRNSY